jgi:hypothetical protein
MDLLGLTRELLPEESLFLENSVVSAYNFFAVENEDISQWLMKSASLTLSDLVVQDNTIPHLTTQFEVYIDCTGCSESEPLFSGAAELDATRLLREELLSISLHTFVARFNHLLHIGRDTGSIENSYITVGQGSVLSISGDEFQVVEPTQTPTSSPAPSAVVSESVEQSAIPTAKTESRVPSSFPSISQLPSDISRLSSDGPTPSEGLPGTVSPSFSLASGSPTGFRSN